MKKRDYHKSSHPSLRNRRVEVEQEKRSFKKMILFFIFLILIILIIYGLFFSPFFQIKKIVISGTDRAEEIAEIENVVQEFMWHKRFFVLPQKNIFILSQSGLKSMLNHKFDLEKIVMTTKLPDRLEIEIKNKLPSLIWQEGEKYFTIYTDAKIKYEITNPQEYELPIVNRGTTTKIVIGQQYLRLEHLDYMQELFALFSFYFKDIKIKNFVVSSLESREVKLITSEDWQIIFSLDSESKESLATVKEVLEQKVKIEDRENLEYIDVRIKDKVYYK